ncbi:hypothetical protein ABPG75_002498 [Micractinium tetrahymenae]
MTGGADGGGGATERLQCNGCWAAVDSKEHAVVTSCHHLYCLNCTQVIMDSDDPGCPICQQLIQNSTVKAQKALAPLADHRLTLCGLSPAVILGAAHEGIQFWNQQQALYGEYAQEQGRRKVAKTQDQCRKKLQEVHNGYLAAKRKYQEVLAQKHALQSDNKELQDKYNQKAMQDKKLKEGFARLQQENEALRRQLAALHKGAMQMGMPPALGLGGGASGRVSRMNVLGAEDGLTLHPGTALAHRAVHPDPSPISSMLGGGGLGGGGGGAFGFDTPDNPPMAMRQMHTSGGSGGGRLQLAGALGPPAGMGARDSRRTAMGFNARERLGRKGAGAANSLGTMASI